MANLGASTVAALSEGCRPLFGMMAPETLASPVYISVFHPQLTAIGKKCTNVRQWNGSLLFVLHASCYAVNYSCLLLAEGEVSINARIA